MYGDSCMSSRPYSPYTLSTLSVPLCNFYLYTCTTRIYTQISVYIRLTSSTP